MTTRLKKAAIVKGPVPWYRAPRPELLLFRTDDCWDLLTAEQDADYPVTGHALNPVACPLGPSIRDDAAGTQTAVCFASLRDEPLPSLRLQPPFLEQAWVTTQTLCNYRIRSQAAADCIVRALTILERPSLWVEARLLPEMIEANFPDWNLAHKSGWSMTADGMYLYSSVPDGVTVWRRLIATSLGLDHYDAVPCPVY